MKIISAKPIKRKPRNKGEKPTWWSRIVFIDPATGLRRDLQRRADNRADARDLVDKLKQDIEKTEGRAVSHELKTFNDLADFFEKHYLKEAQYVDGRKVSGVRSVLPAKSALKALKEYFGSRRLRSITYEDIRQYRAKRLAEPYERGKDEKGEPIKRQRSITSVNRELDKLRRMFNIAQREGWIIKNPILQGDSLISVADEKRRERILTREEEARLLKACDEDQRRAHLRPIIICALDTGMRKGEILSLRWRNVDFENRVLNIEAFHTKTMTARQVSMTIRLAEELEKLWEASPKDKSILVFGIENDVKRSFSTVRARAKLSDVRFHDPLRKLRNANPARLHEQAFCHLRFHRIYKHSLFDKRKQSNARINRARETAITAKLTIKIKLTRAPVE